MAILPISSVSARQNRSSMVTFSGKSEEDSSKIERLPKASAAKAVPVIVLMAMNPGLLNSSGIAKATTLEAEPLTTVMAEASKAHKTGGATYVMNPSEHIETDGLTPGQQNYFRIRQKDIVYFKKTGDGGVLVFEKLNDPKKVHFVHYLPGDKDFKGGYYDGLMARVLVYHDIGKEKEYCGILTRKYVEDSNSPKGGYYLDKEYRLCDDVANDLIHFVTDDSEFVNNANFKWMSTDSEGLLPSEKVEPKNYPY